MAEESPLAALEAQNEQLLDYITVLYRGVVELR